MKMKKRKLCETRQNFNIFHVYSKVLKKRFITSILIIFLFTFVVVVKSYFVPF